MALSQNYDNLRYLDSMGSFCISISSFHQLFFFVSQVKTIFLFLINQLQGLRDPKDPAFKRYFYLLENLAYVKSFNMCFELEDCQEIFCALFSLMFKIVK